MARLKNVKQTEKRKSPMPKQILLVLGCIALLIAVTFASQVFETNDAGFVQVKQAAGTGTMSVRTEPGVYLQMFSNINTYRISDVYDFTRENDRLPVRFGGDGSTGWIEGQIKYRLPMEEASILKLNTDFRSDERVQTDLIRTVVVAAINQTATMFTAEEVYSTRRADFVNLVNEQIKNGIYATTYTETPNKESDGSFTVLRKVSVRTDATGSPIISEPSAFKRYNVELIQLVVNGIDFDDATKNLILERKKADQQKVVAKANAERAQQDALTAEAEGKARVATAEADANVKKMTAVVAAQQEKEVATQYALKAEQEKLAIVAKGEADARAAQLKVAAGLTPLDRATIDKDTKIGIAQALAGVKFPERMIISGGGNGGGVNPFEAVGLKAMYDLSEKMAASPTKGE